MTLCEIMHFKAPPIIGREGGFLRRPREERIGLTIPRLHLKAGAIYALIGPSGAGKSVLQSLIAGFPAFALRSRNSHETYQCFGVELPAETFASRRNLDTATGKIFERGAVLYLPQSLPTDKSFALKTESLMRDVIKAAQENFSITGEIAPLKARFIEMNMPVVLKKKLTALSGGERRRAELLTRLLLLEHSQKPSLVILDEPTTGFDTESEAAFLKEIRRYADHLAKRKVPVSFLISTHAMHHLGEGSVFDEIIVVNRDKNETAHGDHLTCCVVWQGAAVEAPQTLIRPFKEDMREFSWSKLFHAFEKTTTEALTRSYNV